MPRLVFAVFCQQAVVDQTTNNLSIINQYDELHPLLPESVREAVATRSAIVPIQCALVTLWEREKPEISESSAMRIELFSPRGAKLARIEGNLDMQKFKRVRNIGNLPGFPIAGEGTYQFLIKARHGTSWRKAGTVNYVLKYADVGKDKQSRRTN